jgi:ribosome biogenesis protein ENP2
MIVHRAEADPFLCSSLLQTTTNFSSLLPPTNLNDFHHLPGSGMIMVANEGVHMTNYYIPQLGPAPKWCSFLDNVTEEMEDHQGGGISTYNDFKFVEKAELASYVQLIIPNCTDLSLPAAAD